MRSDAGPLLLARQAAVPLGNNLAKPQPVADFAFSGDGGNDDTRPWAAGAEEKDCRKGE